ncbi:MAG TPA: signal recognition particle protein [Amoebophilaceae bacterium]|nr:signal recognition particle protein [Amoebophilaceae bacterium]
MFESLRQNLEKALQTLKGKGRITEINIAATVKEIRRALIKADVHYKVAKQVTDAVKDKSLGRNVLTAVSPGQLFTKIVHEELTTLMGSKKAAVNLTGYPAIILMTGLQGAGKTTFSGKLAAYFKNQNKHVLLVACDIYRPAAMEQLQTVGEQIGVEVYAAPDNKNVLAIAQQAVQHAKTTRQQVVIIDTAGRLAVDEAMMQEIADLKEALRPSETLFVVDAMMGQDAVNTAQAFNERLDFDGVILTKLDGDTRGGAALSIRAVVDKPIKFVGTGEKMTDLDVFHPDRMANRILGMGDVVSLVERAEHVYNAEQARLLEKKLRKNQLDFNDFLMQLQQLKKMGSLKELMGLVPSMSKLVKEVSVDEDTFKPFEAMICSMTPQERAQPHLLDRSRRARIAQGSGMTLLHVNKLLKQFENMSKMMQKISQGGKKQMLGKIKKSLGAA